MNNEPMGNNIDSIIAASAQTERLTLRQKAGRLVGAAVAFVTVGVGANAMLDGGYEATPAVPAAAAEGPAVEGAGIPCDDVVMVCTGDSIVDEQDGDINPSDVTLKDKGEEETTTTSTTIPKSTTTTSTTIPKSTTTTSTTIPKSTTTTTFVPTTTTEGPKHTTTTISRATTTTRPPETVPPTTRPPETVPPTTRPPETVPPTTRPPQTTTPNVSTTLPGVPPTNAPETK